MNSTPAAYIGVLNFLTFGISIIAAVLAIDMYRLLRVSESGRTWRILIIASVLFVFLQVLQIAETMLQLEIANQLSQIVALIFVIALAYAFYRQRAIYSYRSQLDSEVQEEDEEEQDTDDED